MCKVITAQAADCTDPGTPPRPGRARAGAHVRTALCLAHGARGRSSAQRAAVSHRYDHPLWTSNHLFVRSLRCLRLAPGTGGSSSAMGLDVRRKRPGPRVLGIPSKNS